MASVAVITARKTKYLVILDRMYEKCKEVTETRRKFAACSHVALNAPVGHVREAQSRLLTHFSSFSLLLSVKYETWPITAKSCPPGLPVPLAPAVLRLTRQLLAPSDPNHF